MNRIELQMTTAELTIIKRKAEKGQIFIIVFLFFLVGWYWLWPTIGDSFPYVYYSISAFIGILFTFLFVQFFVIKKRTKKDIESKIKISTEFKVIDKYYRSGTNYSYTIVFDSKDIPKYEVIEAIYNKININDSIFVEYSKFGFWLLKIEHNGITIENKRMIK